MNTGVEEKVRKCQYYMKYYNKLYLIKSCTFEISSVKLVRLSGMEVYSK